MKHKHKTKYTYESDFTSIAILDKKKKFTALGALFNLSMARITEENKHVTTKLQIKGNADQYYIPKL